MFLIFMVSGVTGEGSLFVNKSLFIVPVGMFTHNCYLTTVEYTGVTGGKRRQLEESEQGGK